MFFFNTFERHSRPRTLCQHRASSCEFVTSSKRSAGAKFSTLAFLTITSLFSVVSSHCVCRIPLVSAPAGTHARRDTPPRFRARAPAFNPCLYPPHPRRCGDYPASHRIFFRADWSCALQRAWQSSRDKERECAYSSVNATRPTFLVT